MWNYGVPSSISFTQEKKYLRIYKDMFLEQSDESNPSSVKRTFTNPSNDTQGEKWEIQYKNGVVGYLGKITRYDWKHQKYGKKVNIEIITPTTVYIISSAEIDITYRILVSRLSNIDFKKPVWIDVFQKVKKDKNDVPKEYNGRVLKESLFAIKQNNSDNKFLPLEQWGVIEPNKELQEKLPKWKAFEDGDKKVIGYDTAKQTSYLWKCVNHYWNEKHDFREINSFFDKEVKTVSAEEFIQKKNKQAQASPIPNPNIKTENKNEFISNFKSEIERLNGEEEDEETYFEDVINNSNSEIKSNYPEKEEEPDDLPF